MLQDLAALTPPLIVCVAFLIGVGVLVRRELAPKRQARRQALRQARGGAAGSPPGRVGSAGADPEGSARSAPREAETVPDRGDGSQT